MKTNKGKTALITGASGGIGYELAKLFAKDRHYAIQILLLGISSYIMREKND